MSRTRHHGDKAKQREFGDEHRWLSQTPGWWTRLFMTKPQRRAAKLWERRAATSPDVEQEDLPPHGKKPHHYFW